MSHCQERGASPIASAVPSGRIFLYLLNYLPLFTKLPAYFRANFAVLAITRYLSTYIPPERATGGGLPCHPIQCFDI